MAGMKYKDIAEKYNTTINTVKSWKKRYERGTSDLTKTEARKRYEGEKKAVADSVESATIYSVK